MDGQSYTSMLGDISQGSTVNQGTVHASGNAHFGNVINYSDTDRSDSGYKACLRHLLSSLPDDPADHRSSLLTRNGIKGNVLKGTCEWILKTKEYAKWISNNCQLLWISGGPGKGKTMLSLFLIHHLTCASRQVPATRKLVYFFCGSADGRNTGTSVLRGVLYQLLDHSEKIFMDHVKDAFSKHGHRLFAEDRFETLWNIFERMVRDSSIEEIVCILDGLDECVEESSTPLLSKLHDLYKPVSPSARRKSGNRLKIILTSRNYPEWLEDNLYSFPRLRLEVDCDREIRNDVERYIDTRMSDLKCSERLKPNLGTLRTSIKQTLLDRADGTYLWVKFAMESLKKVQCPQLVSTIEKFPTGLEGMYRKMFASISDEEQPIVLEILRWVFTAFRPLTLLEIGTALAITPATDQPLDDAVADYLHYSKGLLIPTERQRGGKSAERVVVPVHSSMLEYVSHIDTQSELNNFRLNRRACHLQVAQVLLDHAQSILTKQMQAPQPTIIRIFSDSTKHPLLEYSLASAIRHLLDGSDNIESLDLTHPLFGEDLPVHQEWLRKQLFTVGHLFVKHTIDLLHVVSLAGYNALVKHLLERKISGKHVDLQDELGRTPLFYAALQEQLGVIEYLLQRGANPNHQDVLGQTAFHIACTTHSDMLVERLLVAGAHVHIESPQPAQADFGTKNADTPKSMLDDDPDQEHVIDHTGTPLHFAIEYGRVTNAARLLREDPQLVHITDNHGQTALHRLAMHYSTERADKELIELVVNAGIDIRARDKNGWSAIHHAAKVGLCDGSDFINAKRIDYDDTQTLVVLVNNGAPIDLPTGASVEHPGGMTPLQISCRGAKDYSARYLLEHGADVNHVDGNGRTALHWVCHTVPHFGFGDQAWICSTLLGKMKESSIRLKDNQGMSALDIALETDREYQARLTRLEEEPYDDPDLQGYQEIMLNHIGYKPLHVLIQFRINKIRLCHGVADEKIRRVERFYDKDITDEDLEGLFKQRKDYAARCLAVVPFRGGPICKTS